jgi:hypothetical protein
MDTSYDIICAAERNAPKNAYFELLAQPDIIIPYTANDDIANKYNTPKFISANTTPFPIGITAQPNNAKQKVIIGAIRNTIVLALLGKTVSFTNNFAASANG